MRHPNQRKRDKTARDRCAEKQQCKRQRIGVHTIVSTCAGARSGEVRCQRKLCHEKSHARRTHPSDISSALDRSTCERASFVTNEDGLTDIAIVFELVDEKLRDFEARDPTQRGVVDICDR